MKKVALIALLITTLVSPVFAQEEKETIWLVIRYIGTGTLEKIPMKTLTGCEANGLKLTKDWNYATYFCIKEQ